MRKKRYAIDFAASNRPAFASCLAPPKLRDLGVHSRFAIIFAIFSLTRSPASFSVISPIIAPRMSPSPSLSDESRAGGSSWKRASTASAPIDFGGGGLARYFAVLGLRVFGNLSRTFCSAALENYITQFPN